MKVIPFSITYPGAYVNLANAADTSAVGNLLGLGESCLVEAAVALGAYSDAKELASKIDPDARMIRRRRIGELQDTVRAELNIGGNASREQLDQIRVEAARRLLVELAAQGTMPNKYRHRRVFVFARSFLFSLARLRQVFSQLSEIQAIKAPADAALGALDLAVPKLVGVRDSSAHADERAVGEECGRPIKHKNDAIPAIVANGNTLLENLVNDNFGSTMANGHHGEVAVTQQTFDACVEAFNLLVQGLTWTGPREVAPSPFSA